MMMMIMMMMMMDMELMMMMIMQAAQQVKKFSPEFLVLMRMVDAHEDSFLQQYMMTMFDQDGKECRCRF